MGTVSAFESINDSVSHRVQRLARLFRAHLLRRIRELGFHATPEQWFVLQKLVARDGQTQSELGDEAFSDRPSLTRMLDAMEREQWISRTTDPKDSRKRLVFLTSQGRAAAADISKMARVERAVLFSGLNDEELATTVRVLMRLEQNATQRLQARSKF